MSLRAFKIVSVILLVTALIVGTLSLVAFISRKTREGFVASEEAWTARVEHLKTQTATMSAEIDRQRELRESAEARARTAEATAIQARAEGERRIAEVRKPIAPARRAERVAKLIGVPSGDIVPYSLDGRPGHWLTEGVLIELEATRTASSAWLAEGNALRAQIVAERAVSEHCSLEREGLRDLAEARLVAFNEAEKARAELAVEVQKATPWYLEPALWATIGAVGGGAIVVGIVRTVND